MTGFVNAAVRLLLSDLFFLIMIGPPSCFLALHLNNLSRSRPSPGNCLQASVMLYVLADIQCRCLDPSHNSSQSQLLLYFLHKHTRFRFSITSENRSISKQLCNIICFDARFLQVHTAFVGAPVFANRIGYITHVLWFLMFVYMFN